VARALFATLFLALILGVPSRAQIKAPPPPPAGKEQEPPEEDESLKPKEYALNPLQATKEINVGNQYLKKGNLRAASNRYLEATRWDPGSPEAFLKLGETREKLRDFPAARDAFAKYFELAPDAKDADAIKKRMAKWPVASSSTGSGAAAKKQK
jgi:tetratricopeptide (TPR) repeat protein